MRPADREEPGRNKGEEGAGDGRADFERERKEV
jgi:hypothetical protein